MEAVGLQIKYGQTYLQYMPIATMNDAGNRMNLSDHLCIIAGQRVKHLVEKVVMFCPEDGG